MRGSAVSLVVALGCGSSLPRLPAATQPDDAFVDVPYPPPAAHVEQLPPKPSARAVWVDGQWVWNGGWVWTPGAWVAVPGNARFAPWALRRTTDGQLQFAAAAWRDPTGRELRGGPRVLATARGEEDEATIPARCR
jgi:hypothetical protein